MSSKQTLYLSCDKCRSMGVIYKDNDKIRLSRLGLQMKNLEHNLNEAKERILSDVRTTAVDILSRYQLKNPVDGPDLPSSCDVLPCICIWKAMRELDNKIGYEEMNRVILHVMEMSQLDEAIQIIRNARMKYDRGKERFNIFKPTIRQLLYPENQ